MADDSTFHVWRDGHLIGAGFKTLAEAKAYAKRNSSFDQMVFTIGRNKGEYRAMFSMNSRAQWEQL